MTQFGPPPAVTLPAPSELRTIYPGCGADALRLCLDPKLELARRKRLGFPLPPRMTRAARLDEALLLLDIEVMLWPTKVMPFMEHHAQHLAALYAAHEAAP